MTGSSIVGKVEIRLERRDLPASMMAPCPLMQSSSAVIWGRCGTVNSSRNVTFAVPCTAHSRHWNLWWEYIWQLRRPWVPSPWPEFIA